MTLADRYIYVSQRYWKASKLVIKAKENLISLQNRYIGALEKNVLAGKDDPFKDINKIKSEFDGLKDEIRMYEQQAKYYEHMSALYFYLMEESNLLDFEGAIQIISLDKAKKQCDIQDYEGLVY